MRKNDGLGVPKFKKNSYTDWDPKQIGLPSEAVLEKRLNDTLQAADKAGLIADRPSKDRARSWLKRLSMGQLSDLRTNIFLKSSRGVKGKEREWLPYAVITSQFDKVMKSVYNTLNPTVVKRLDEWLESGNREKIGPKSMALGYFADGPLKVKAVMSDKKVSSNLDVRRVRTASDRVVDLLERGVTRLLDVKDVLRNQRSPEELHDPEAPGLDPTTNSGEPFYLGRWVPNPLTMDGKRLEYTERVYSWITRKAIEQSKMLQTGRHVDFAAMVGQRTVCRGLKPLESEKTKRLIMAMGKSEAIQWKRFTPLLMEALRNVTYGPSHVMPFMAWCDAPIIDVECQRMLNYAHTHNQIVLSGDVSNFDASVNPHILMIMAEQLSKWFQPKYQKFFIALNESVMRYTTCISPDGLHGPVWSSIKSGSGGTNFMDSMFNSMALFFGEELGLYKVEGFAVQGDDLIATGINLTGKSVSAAYKMIGLEAHPDKQLEEAGALSYLQRLHLLGSFGGIGSVYRVLGSTLVLEKNRFGSDEWGPYAEAIQAIAKLENAAFHPGFEELVRFVKDGDKFLLGANLPPEEVIKRAGLVAGSLLSTASGSFSSDTVKRTPSGFANSSVNGVLRGEVMPPFGSKARFLRVYGQERLDKLGVDLSLIA